MFISPQPKNISCCELIFNMRVKMMAQKLMAAISAAYNDVTGGTTTIALSANYSVVTGETTNHCSHKKL